MVPPQPASSLLVFGLAGFFLSCGENPEEAEPEYVPLALSAVAAGGYANCGLDPDGRAYCWGNGRYGQLGLAAAPEECSSIPGEDPCASSATAVSTDERFTAIVAGGLHACGLATDGTVWCWGDDEYGQVGDVGSPDTCGIDHTPCARTPRRAYLPPAVLLTAGGTHTCALHPAGIAYCWGYGPYGRLGTGSTDNQDLPKPVADTLRFVSLSAGVTYTCGLTADGTAFCWGYNAGGELGDGTTTWRDRPTPVATGVRFRSIVAGGPTCGITVGGETHCWGGGVLTPSRLAGDPGFTALASGAPICGISPAGSFCWDGVPGWSAVPAEPTRFGTLGPGTAGEAFLQVTLGYGIGCGIVNGPLAYCWGSDWHGSLGDGPPLADDSLPVVVRIQAVDGGGRN